MASVAPQSRLEDAQTTWLTAIAEAPLEGPAQSERRREICDKYRAGMQTVTAARMVAEVRGLTGHHRMNAIHCLRPKQSFVMGVGDLVQLTFGVDDRDNRSLLCSFRNNLSTPQNAQSIAMLLGDLSGYQRQGAIHCLSDKLEPQTLATASAMQVLGNLVPEQYAGWDATLANYNSGYHIASLCVLADYLERDISAEEAALLLGQSRNSARKRGVACIRQAIRHGLSWEDVDTVLGPSIANRGDMIDLLGERTPDGLNARNLQEFMERYRNRRYLNDPDPPGWLNGQCIAFARLARQQVTGASLALQFGQASNIVRMSATAGLVTETDPAKARVGALVVWDDGGAGHVGVVVGIRRNGKTGLADRITVGESNWGVATNSVTTTWGISIEEARRELVSDRYGYFDTFTLPTASLDRAPPRAKEPLSYRFVGYVLP